MLKHYLYRRDEMNAELEKIALLEQINNAFQMVGVALSVAVAPHIAQQVSNAGITLLTQVQSLKTELRRRLANDDGPRARDLRWMSQAISRAHDVAQQRPQDVVSDLKLHADDPLTILTMLSPRRFSAKDPRSLALITARYFEAGLYNIPLGDTEPHFNGGTEVVHVRNSRHFLYTGNDDRGHEVFTPLPGKDHSLIYDVNHPSFTFRDMQDNGSIVKTRLYAGGRMDVTVEHNALEDLEHPGQRTHFNSSAFFKRLDEQLSERGLQDTLFDAPDTVSTFREVLGSLMQTSPVPRHFHHQTFQWVENPDQMEVNRPGARMIARYTAEEGVGHDQDVGENAALTWCLKFDSRTGLATESLFLKGSDSTPLHLENRRGEVFKLATSENEFLDGPLSNQGDNIVYITGNGWKYLTQELQRRWPAMISAIPRKKVTVEDNSPHKEA
jgi:hypothetical protein